MKEVLRRVGLSVFILLMSFIGFKFIMSFKTEPKINELVESVKLVKTSSVELGQHKLSIPVYGNLQSLDEIEIYPEVGGALKSKGFREGRAFNKGEVIAFIDNTEFLNNLKSQKSNLLNQVAKLVADLKFDFPNEVDEWEAFFDKIKFDRRLPVLPNVDDPKLKNYLAGKNFYSNYFSIKSQEDRLSKYTIIAPFNGILSEANIKPGTVVRVGQKIGKFINNHAYEIEANVSLSEGYKVKTGDTVLLTSNDIEGKWKGVVSRINRSLSTSSQNMGVFIRVNSKELYHGMYLFGDVQLGESENTVEVSRNLLNGNKIFKVESGKLVEVEVNILQVKKGTAIVSGLEEDDVILGESFKGAYNGMKVRS